MLTRYRNKIKNSVSIQFDDIVTYAQMSLPDEYYDSPFKYFHCGNRSRGATPIDEELGLICYLAAYGRLHKEKLLLALNHMHLKSICPQRINIVDWGCGQGLASLVFLDYIESQGIECSVDSITLIEPSALAIDYAELYINQKVKDSATVLYKVNKPFENLQGSDFSTLNDNPTFHIYSNVLDVQGISMKDLTSWFKLFKATDNYIVCASPKYYSGDTRISTFFSYLNNPLMIWSAEESNKLDNIWDVNFTFNIKIAKLLAEAKTRIRELKFFSPRQFYACHILDSMQLARDYCHSQSAFDVYAPYEIGSSYKDNIDPIYAVLSNIISRGLPTKASPYIEEELSRVFSHSRKEVKYGAISYPSLYNDSRIQEILCQIRSAETDEAAAVILTPLAVARIQKTIVEALISGRLSVEKETWDVVIEESDVPCGALALKDLEILFNNLTSLSELYQDRKFPKVNLTIINKEYLESALHQNAEVFSSAAEVADRIFDLVIDYHSFVKPEEEYAFSKYNVKTDCYYAIYQANEVIGQRYVYTTDLIDYKPLTSVDNTGSFIENVENRTILEYFLQLLFRKESFRMGQLPILNRALRNKSVIGLLPTGGGKSLTYQLAALLQPGITLVIDPLQSLMQDQYDGLLANGIDFCTYINSSITDSVEKTQREYQLERSQCLFVFMSPERLCMYSFRKRLQNMYDLNVYFSYGVIDEVHCVSEWGQDFRFTYLHLGRNMYNYVKSKSGVVTLFGLTATASFDVLADVERELSGHGSYTLDSDALVRCEDTNRLELQYRVISVPIEYYENTDYDKNSNIDPDLPRPVKIKTYNINCGKSSQLQDIIDSVPQMTRELMTPESINRIVERFYERQSSSVVPNAGASLPIAFPDNFAEVKETYPQAGIIFCPHRKSTDMSVEVCASKLMQRTGHIGRFYSQDDDYDANAKDSFNPMQNMTDFRDNKLPIMVATKAFGMGIDKPNVRFTINMNYSNSLEGYVQEAGRAGRDKAMALSIILVSDYSLVRIKSKCDITAFPMMILKGKWFKEEDLDEILNHYRIKLDKKKWLEFCNPNTDVVQLECHYKKDALLNKDNIAKSCPMCDRKAKCKLPQVRELQPGYCTIDELLESAQSVGCTLVGRNIRYQSPDYQAMMYFYGKGYPGLYEEKEIMYNLMSKFSVSSFIGDTVEVNHQAIRTQKGFLDYVLSQEVGKEVVSIISYAGEDDMALSKAIYRMCCIGFIDDFTKDYNKKKYRIVCVRKSDNEYYNCLKQFLMRYYPEDKAERELAKAKEKRGDNVIHKCLAYLTDFIYEKLAVKKKRAVDDIRAFCNLGLNKEKDWKEVNEDLKDYIYYYFNSKFAKEDFVAENGEPYSLTIDTDYGKDAPLELVHKYIKVVDDDVCGTSGNPNDNVKHLQGAVRLIMRSLTNDNPVIDLLNVYCILMLGEYKRNKTILTLLESSYENAYNALWNEFENKTDFYKYISEVKKDMFEHGVDKSYAEEMEVIELNAEVNRYRTMINNLNWKIKN